MPESLLKSNFLSLNTTAFVLPWWHCLFTTEEACKHHLTEEKTTVGDLPISIYLLSNLSFWWLSDHFASFIS